MEIEICACIQSAQIVDQTRHRKGFNMQLHSDASALPDSRIIAAGDIAILGRFDSNVGDPPSAIHQHRFEVPTGMLSSRLDLALAILECIMRLSCERAGNIVSIQTNAAGLEPTAYNARRRLALVLNEAVRILTDVDQAVAMEELRPILHTELTADSRSDGTIFVSGGTSRVDVGGIRYVFAESCGGVCFGKPVDGFRRMENWASGPEVSLVLSVLISRRLGVPCAVHPLHGGWCRRGFEVCVPEHVELMDAIDAGNIAEKVWKSAEDRLSTAIRELPWAGDNSLFEEEFNDARDNLVAKLAGGGTLTGTWAGYREPGFTTIDGEAVEPAAVVRLVGRHSSVVGRLLEFDRGAPPESFSATLRKDAKLEDRTMRPREFAVSFRAFEENCQYRQHFDERECNHRKGDSSCCSVAVCPRVAPTYAGEVDRFNEDPHLNRFNDDWDTPVVALHRNTERSFSWLAAGKERLRVIVSKVADAWGIGAHFLAAKGDVPAVREAVEKGYLEIVEENDIGPIVTLGPKCRDEVARQAGERSSGSAQVT